MSETTRDMMEIWAAQFLRELERLNLNIQRLEAEIHKMNVEMAVLKFKNTLFGAIGGSIPLAAYVLYQVFSK